MKRSLLRLGLSLMLAAGWWVQRLPAQAPCGCGREPQADAAPGMAPDVPYRSFLRRVSNHFGMCCWTTHNQPGCGSLHSEAVFVLGSCHAFFGEPCLTPPPRRPPNPAPAYATWGMGEILPP